MALGLDAGAVRAELERYYDGVPRSAARAEDFGALTLFVRNGAGHSYYARPTLAAGGPITADDVRAVRVRQSELGIAQAFEWVAEISPSLASAAAEAGLDVHRHPLLVLAQPATDAAPPTGPDEIVIRRLAPDDPALASALAVPHLAFGEAGTQIGAADRTDLARRTAAIALDGSPALTSERIQSGRTTMIAALEGDVALCSGQHNPMGRITEIVGVGTLPSMRRRGLAGAVTSALARDAVERGIGTVFLSAGDDDVARIYERIGFRRVGTAMIAEPG